MQQDRDSDLGSAQDKCTENMALFFLGLQAKHLVPISTVSAIANEMKVLQDIQHEFTMDLFSRGLQEYGVPDEALQNLGKHVYEQSPIQGALHESSGTLSTHHKRLQYYRKEFSLVEPVQITLGHDDKGKAKHFNYVPILESLKAILRNKSVQHQILNPIHADKNMLCDVVDGHVAKSNELFASDPHALQIMLFQDAVEVTNPLGSARKKHKVLAVYYTLGNIYVHNRSTVDSIQLVLLCSEKDCKLFGPKRVFDNLMSDLCELESTGICVDGKTYRGSIACVIGDNLGSHYLGGFSENFSSTQHFCRYCHIRKEDFQTNPLSTATERTPASYSESLLELENKPDVQMHNGIKSNSVLNTLAHFHVCAPGLPPCLAHDLFEGIAEYDLAMYLEVVQRKWFSYDFLNRRIATFTGESQNKANVVPTNGTKLGGHAAQNWWLLRFLPVLIHDRVKDAKDEVWQLALLLRQVVELVCAPALSESQVAYMKVLIEEYIETRHLLLPLKKLRPKHHYLLHYADLTLHFGPLIHTWTMRFESKNSYFKRCIRASKNFKNITKSLSERHQLLQAYQSRGNVFSPELIMSDSTRFYPELYDSQFKGALEAFDLSASNAVVTDQITVRGTCYTTDMLVILSCEVEQLILGLIACIVVKQQKTVHLVLRQKRASLDPDLGVFEVENDGGTFTCKKLDELLDYIPLRPYQRGGRLLVVLKHSPPWSM